MLKETFGENVRYYRKKKKLTLESAAELCDISSRYLGRIERAGKREEGKPSVSIDIIEKISKGLEIPVEKLLVVRRYEKDSFHADKKETAPLRGVWDKLESGGTKHSDSGRNHVAGEPPVAGGTAADGAAAGHPCGSGKKRRAASGTLTARITHI